MQVFCRSLAGDYAGALQVTLLVTQQVFCRFQQADFLASAGAAPARHTSQFHKP